MKKHRTRIILAASFLLGTLGLFSQNPMALYFMETIPQTSQINPAMQPRANKFYTVASINQVFQSDLAFRDVFQKAGNKWVTIDSKDFDFDKLYNVIGSTVNFNEYFDVDLFGFGFRTGKGYFTLSMLQRTVFQSGLPSDFFKIAETGFADNSHFDLSTFRQKTMVYTQISLGYSHPINDKLTIGVNLKPLLGQVAVMTDIDRLKLNTSRQIWEVDARGDVYASMPIELEGEPGKFPDEIKFKDFEVSDIKEYLNPFRNPGIATDLGAVYKLDHRWTFSAALNNLGFISWRKDLNQLSVNGNYDFEGINVDASNKDNLDDAMDEILDSLENVMVFDTKHNRFSTALTPHLYVGASYHLTPAVSFGLLSRSTFQKQNFRQDFSLSANLQPYSFVALNMNLSQRVQGSTFAGLGLTFLLGPLQFYILTDHLPLRYSEVEIDGDKFPISKKMKDVTVMTGLNFVFGRHGYKDAPMINR
jgi:hypothetical protein